MTSLGNEILKCLGAKLLRHHLGAGRLELVGKALERRGAGLSTQISEWICLEGGWHSLKVTHTGTLEIALLNRWKIGVGRRFKGVLAHRLEATLMHPLKIVLLHCAPGLLIKLLEVVLLHRLEVDILPHRLELKVMRLLPFYLLDHGVVEPTGRNHPERLAKVAIQTTSTLTTCSIRTRLSMKCGSPCVRLRIGRRMKI